MKEEDPSRKQIIDEASSLKGKYKLCNGLIGIYEITRRDLHSIVYEMSKEITSQRREIVMAIRDIIENGEYIGWSMPDNGTHQESAFFVYYCKSFEGNVYVGMRFIRERKVFKPY